MTTPGHVPGGLGAGQPYTGADHMLAQQVQATQQAHNIPLDLSNISEVPAGAAPAQANPLLRPQSIPPVDASMSALLSSDVLNGAEEEAPRGAETLAFLEPHLRVL